MDHKHRTQFLRMASVRQPTMYSYMASHRYLYQIVFTHLALTQQDMFTTFQFIPDEIRPDTTLSNSRHDKQT